ncbi:MAG: hypothetical protein E6Q97_20735 [Desulfurellales bacterium]|nr:MAG: hypothetical protein E6Q97_20735 [Desulfurellales bacterium]
MANHYLLVGVASRDTERQDATPTTDENVDDMWFEGELLNREVNERRTHSGTKRKPCSHRTPRTEGTKGPETMPELKTTSRITALQNLLTYSPGDGRFRWKANNKLVKITRVKGDNGLVRRVISGHGLFVDLTDAAWILGYGTEPDGPVVFVDGDSLNITLRNLTVFRGQVIELNAGRFTNPVHRLEQSTTEILINKSGDTEIIRARMLRSAVRVITDDKASALMWLRMALLAVDGVRDQSTDNWMKSQG